MEDSEFAIKEGYKQTEVGIIPEDWKVSTVGREFEIQLGKRLDEGNNFGVLKPFVTNKSVQWNKIDINELPVVPMMPLDLKRLRLRQDDLLVCEGGEVGRGAIWNCPIDECYYQNTLHRLRPLRKFNSKLFLELLGYWTARNKLADYVSKTSIAHLTREKFAEVPLPVPPLPEQQAIAEVLSDADALITSLDQLIAKKRNIKQGAMQLLLTGKKRLQGFSGDWEVSTVGREFEIKLGKMLDTDKNVGTLKPYIGNKSVQWNRIDIDELQMIAMTQADLKRFRLRQGDLLVCEGGEVGRAAIWESPIEECYYQKALHRLRPLRKFNTKLFLEFLHYWTDHGMLGNYVSQTSIAHLTREKFAEVPLLVPPLLEQKAIARILSDMDAEIEALEKKRAKYKAVKQGMTQELLTGKTRLI